MATHGLYENCSPSEPESLTRLEEMRGAGFTRVLNYWAWQGTDAEIVTYAEHADELGIKLIWPAGATDKQINLVRNHPATWGFYVGEEQGGGIIPYARRVRERAPNSRRLYVEWGLHLDTLSYKLDMFAGSAITHIGADYYPVGVDTGGSITDTDRCAQIVKNQAQKTGQNAVMVLQGFAWSCEPNLAPPGSHEWPTEAQMRLMRKRAESQNIPLILWFDYFFIKPPGTTDTTRLDALSAALTG